MLKDKWRHVKNLSNVFEQKPIHIGPHPTWQIGRSSEGCTDEISTGRGKWEQVRVGCKVVHFARRVGWFLQSHFPSGGGKGVPGRLLY